MNNTGIKLFCLIALIILTGLGGCGHPNSPPVIESMQSLAERVDTLKSCEIVSVISDIDDDALYYEWSASGGEISGNKSSVTWTAPDTAGMYKVSLTVKDEHGKTSSASIDVNVRKNMEPVINGLVIRPQQPFSGDNLTLACSVIDPDNDELKFTWFIGQEKISGDTAEVNLASPLNPGDYLVRVEVDDGRGGLAASEKEVKILANQPPVIRQLTARTLKTSPGTPVKIDCSAEDPEGAALLYSWEASGGSVIGEGRVINWRAPEKYGTYTVKVTVIDPRGESDSSDISIAVGSCG